MPCCSVCHTRYDEDERVPLLLSCGHGFCKACLTRLFSSSADTTLSCPRCRHPTVVGNSVHALRKNFPILSLLSSSPSSPSFECDFTDEDSHGDDDDEEDFIGREFSRQLSMDEAPNGDDYFSISSRSRQRRSRLSRPSVSGSCCSSPIDLASHHDLKLLKLLGERSRRTVQETWSAVLSSGGGKCKHQVAVKRVTITEGMDVVDVMEKLEKLRRASMWCSSVCTFHGAIKMDRHLCLIMDRYVSSVQAEMQKNNGRLTLEQILRFSSLCSRHPLYSVLVEPATYLGLSHYGY